MLATEQVEVEVKVKVEVVRPGHHVQALLVHLRILIVTSTTVGGLLQDMTQIQPCFMGSNIFW